jgi:hypothetical protein
MCRGLEKLIVAQLVKKFPDFYRPEFESSLSTKPATGVTHLSLQRNTVFFIFVYNNILPFVSRSTKLSSHVPCIMMLHALNSYGYVTFIRTFSSYLTGNTARPHYKDRLVSAVYGNSCCSMREETHKTLCGQNAEYMNAEGRGKYSGYCALKCYITL